MRKPLLAFFLLGFLAASPASSQVSSAHARIKVVQHSVTVDQPAYAGEPIWIHTEPTGKVHYPFRTGIGDFGCNRLELMHDGKMLSPRKLKIWGDASGILCGWVAPPNAPTDRLPLHVRFQSLRSGQYAVRWISEVPDLSKGRPQVFDIASDWTTFVIDAPPAGQREAWLRNLLEHVPSDPGMLAGEYIPNLVAAAPDARALRAIAEQLYADNQVVAQLAASALQVFPQDDVTALLTRLFDAQGPSDVLARVVCADSLRIFPWPPRQFVRMSRWRTRQDDNVQRRIRRFRPADAGRKRRVTIGNCLRVDR